MVKIQTIHRFLGYGLPSILISASSGKGIHVCTYPLIQIAALMRLTQKQNVLEIFHKGKKFAWPESTKASLVVPAITWSIQKNATFASFLK